MTAAMRPAIDPELAAALREAERLRLQVSSLLTTHQRLSSLLMAADTRIGDLQKLLVSVRTLIESRDARAALAALRDLLVTVIGADDFVVYTIDPLDRMLVPIAGAGPLHDAPARVRLDRGWIGQVVRAGTVVMGSAGVTHRRAATHPDITAIVPLKVLDQVVGAIIIAHVLPHRDRLRGCDRELLGLLGVYAATAIIAAGRRTDWHTLPLGLT